jgi:hypothetical protein
MVNKKTSSHLCYDGRTGRIINMLYLIILELIDRDGGVMSSVNVTKFVCSPNPVTGRTESFKYEYTDKLTKSNIQSLIMRLNLPTYSLPEQDAGKRGTSGRIYQEK